MLQKGDPKRWQSILRGIPLQRLGDPYDNVPSGRVGREARRPLSSRVIRLGTKPADQIVDRFGIVEPGVHRSDAAPCPLG